MKVILTILKDAIYNSISSPMEIRSETLLQMVNYEIYNNMLK